VIGKYLAVKCVYVFSFAIGKNGFDTFVKGPEVVYFKTSFGYNFTK